jgi:hypothetical protein
MQNNFFYLSYYAIVHSSKSYECGIYFWNKVDIDGKRFYNPRAAKNVNNAVQFPWRFTSENTKNGWYVCRIITEPNLEGISPFFVFLNLTNVGMIFDTYISSFDQTQYKSCRHDIDYALAAIAYT